jgi:hypothetical protein
MLSLVGHPDAVNPDHDLKQVAREKGWEIRDFRTGRKAARVGVPAAAGMGAVAGGIAVGLALRRRYYSPSVATRAIRATKALTRR